MKRADVELMTRLHELVPLVVVIAKADTMTKSETREFKAEVRQQLQSEGVRPFAFDPRAIQQVERLHASHAASGFEPLYGGSDGLMPWAVMGSDESRREYLWGTAITNEPTHSELPALRDLLLRADGWSHLKREAALKADAYVELQARSQAAATPPSAPTRVPRAPWLALSLRQLAFGLLALSAAVLQAHLVREHALGQAAQASRRDTTLLHGLLERRAEGLQDKLTAVERERSELRRELRKLGAAHASCKEALGKVNTEMDKQYTWWSRSKRVGLEHHVYE
jgi:septin 7